MSEVPLDDSTSEVVDENLPPRLGPFDGPVGAIIAAIRAHKGNEPPRIGPDQFHPDGVDEAWRQAGTWE